MNNRKQLLNARHYFSWEARNWYWLKVLFFLDVSMQISIVLVEIIKKTHGSRFQFSTKTFIEEMVVFENY